MVDLNTDTPDIALARKLVALRKEHGEVQFITCVFLTEGGACGRFLSGRAGGIDLVAVNQECIAVANEVAQKLGEQHFKTEQIIEDTTDGVPN